MVGGAVVAGTVVGGTVVGGTVDRGTVAIVGSTAVGALVSVRAEGGPDAALLAHAARASALQITSGRAGRHLPCRERMRRRLRRHRRTMTPSWPSRGRGFRGSTSRKGERGVEHGVAAGKEIVETDRHRDVGSDGVT